MPEKLETVYKTKLSCLHSKHLATSVQFLIVSHEMVVILEARDLKYTCTHDVEVPQLLYYLFSLFYHFYVYLAANSPTLVL